MTADEVRRLREALGMTQREFAVLIGVREHSVWRWENGYRIGRPYEELIRHKVAFARVVVGQPATA